MAFLLLHNYTDFIEIIEVSTNIIPAVKVFIPEIKVVLILSLDNS